MFTMALICEKKLWTYKLSDNIKLWWWFAVLQYLIMAHTSPAKFLLQAVLVRYSVGFSLYVSSIKFLYARYL